MSYFFGVVLFGFGIALTIALHEWGHFATARFFGMKVRRFFIGFGPTVFSVTRGETVYGLKAIPLGGFCDIAGMTNQDEVTEEEAPRAMMNKPWWQRIIVLLGGIAMNLIIAGVILYGLAVTSGLPNPNVDTTAVVAETSCVASQREDETLEDCQGLGPAAAAGIAPGDRILKVDDITVESFPQLRDYVMEHPNETVNFTIDRDGQELFIPLMVAAVDRLDANGSLTTVGAVGISSAPLELYKQYAPIPAVAATASFGGTLLHDTISGLASFPAKIPGVVASIFGAERQADGPISVVGASHVGGVLAQRSAWPMFFMLLASLNFFLALFNVVPLPPLDGGHIAVVVYERIRDLVRRMRGLAPAGPADYTKLMPLTMAVAAVLVGVGAIVVIADIVSPIQILG